MQVLYAFCIRFFFIVFFCCFFKLNSFYPISTAVLCTCTTQLNHPLFAVELFFQPDVR